MTSITGDGGWRIEPLGGPAGTGFRLARGDEGVGEATKEPRMVGTVGRPSHLASLQTVGSATLGGVGIAALLGGGPVGARLGAAGIGKGIGIAVGVAALAGAGFLLHQSRQNASTEYQLTFAEQPDLSGVAPGDVYATLRAHHERNAPAIERELGALVDEGKVRSFSGIIGANGFVIDVVNRHREEVEQRLDAIAQVGDLVASPLG
jgi:hypothetical protein